jgi:hypothetical protein
MRKKKRSNTMTVIEYVCLPLRYQSERTVGQLQSLVKESQVSEHLLTRALAILTIVPS